MASVPPCGPSKSVEIQISSYQKKTSRFKGRGVSDSNAQTSLFLPPDGTNLYRPSLFGRVGLHEPNHRRDQNPTPILKKTPFTGSSSRRQSSSADPARVCNRPSTGKKLEGQLQLPCKHFVSVEKIMKLLTEYMNNDASIPFRCPHFIENRKTGAIEPCKRELELIARLSCGHEVPMDVWLLMKKHAQYENTKPTCVEEDCEKPVEFSEILMRTDSADEFDGLDLRNVRQRGAALGISSMVEALIGQSH